MGEGYEGLNREAFMRWLEELSRGVTDLGPLREARARMLAGVAKRERYLEWHAAEMVGVEQVFGSTGVAGEAGLSAWHRVVIERPGENGAFSLCGRVGKSLRSFTAMGPPERVRCPDCERLAAEIEGIANPKRRTER
jgi:hypothetical protein